MALPADPMILLSVLNTKLRDSYPSLAALCEDLGEQEAAVRDTLAAAGFTYDENANQFR